MTPPLTFVAPLFVPADRPERFAKAAASGADCVILDLEDAVAADAKVAARNRLTTEFTNLPVVVRINAAGTRWHDADLDAAARLPLAAIMLPKAECDADVARVAAVHPVVALIETVQGIAALPSLAASGHAARLAFGSVDYAADLGCAHAREPLSAARAALVFTSRRVGMPAPLDGVTTEVADDRATTADAIYARAMGFGGKLTIHPRQVRLVRAAFQPSEGEIEWALRVLASGDGAAVVDGAMIDEPVRIRARFILATASQT
jgi:citrate lyase subunit beta / citryl-CoA lyase